MAARLKYKFHQMVDTIDLTLSDSEESDAQELKQTPTPCYTSLPLRCARATPSRPGKRAREDTPCPRIRFLSIKRARKESHAQSSAQYLDGVFKRVRVLGHIRPNDITLPEVLDVPTLDEAVVSSFAWDIHWLLSEVGLGWVNTTFIADNRGRDSYAMQAQQAPRGTLSTQRWHFPPRNARGCAHGKLMLLFRKDGTMRIAIPTGNLRRTDWGAPAPSCGQLLSGTGQSLDNFVFMIDLPLQKQGVVPRADNEVAFQRELRRYLEAMAVPLDIQKRILQYNFAACAPYRFIWSGDARHPFSGFLSLATAVNELNCAPPAGAKIDVEYATSSLGRMSKRFRAQLWFALEGQYHSHGIIPTYERRDYTFRIRFPSAQSASSAPNCIRRLDLFSLEVSPGSEEEKFLDATLVDNPPKALLSHAKVLRVTWQIGSVHGVQAGSVEYWLLGSVLKRLILETPAYGIDVAISGRRYKICASNLL
ncbi:phospholipase D/nuclease [Phaeosphaeriaceae sp. SRC1lsM3a]|nr:phospholipase D/nuclease [Stagonospora sp. SRC1lsM3a]